LKLHLDLATFFACFIPPFCFFCFLFVADEEAGVDGRKGGREEEKRQLPEKEVKRPERRR
jgi:hypothetical protein